MIYNVAFLCYGLSRHHHRPSQSYFLVRKTFFENGVNFSVGSRPSDRSKESLDSCFGFSQI